MLKEEAQWRVDRFRAFRDELAQLKAGGNKQGGVYRNRCCWNFSLCFFALCFVLCGQTAANAKAVNEISISEFVFKFASDQYEGVTGVLYDNKGQPLVALDNFFVGMSHQFTVIGDELFWLSGPLYDDYGTRTVELCVTNLKNKQTITLFSNQNINFLPNHKGSAIAISHNSYDKITNEGHSAVTLIDREHNKVTELASSVESYTMGFHNLIGWSTDDSMLWIAEGLIDFWDSLVLYKKGKVLKYDYLRGSDDTIIDCDRGLVTYSDYPVIHTSDDREEFEKSTTTTTLWLYDLFNEKRAMVAKGRANMFSPKWDTTIPNNPKLIFFIGRKPYKVDPIQLLKSKGIRVDAPALGIPPEAKKEF